MKKTAPRGIKDEKDRASWSQTLGDKGLRMKKTAQGGIKDERDTHHVGLRMKSDTRYMDLRMKSDTRLLAYCFWSSSVEIPRQLEATRWMDFDFRVARVSFLDFQLARVTSIWRVAQIHLARVFFRRLYI